MKRWRIALIAGMLVVLAGAVALAGPPQPLHIRGPFLTTEANEALYPNTFHPVTQQVFPEGCVGNGFHTWLVVYNSSNQPANVVIVANGANHLSVTDPFLLECHQRRTIDANEYFKWEEPDVSFQVFSDYADVYAQLSMYWDGGGHTSTGFFK